MSQPAPYPDKDASEVEAVNVFQSLLNAKIVKADIAIRDKKPNTDGTIELVDDDGRPIGKLDVQVRKMKDGATSHSCPSSLVAYSNISVLPVIFVAVDTANKRAYWKHVKLPMPEYKPDQDSFTVKFDENVDAIGASCLYVGRWQEIVAEYQTRLSEYPLLKGRIDEELELKSLDQADIIYFQTYVDMINRLLDNDFAVLKKAYFSEVWKFGVGVYGADKTRVSYQIYAIPFGSNAPILTSFVGRPLEEMWRRRVIDIAGASTGGHGSGRVLSGRWVGRMSLERPETEARKFVFNYVARAVGKRIFTVHGRLLSQEYLYWFLEWYHECLGLPKSDTYDVCEVNRALREFFPSWYALAFQKYLQRNAHLIPTGVFPSFENVAGSWPRQQITKDEVLRFLESGKIPPSVPITTEFFSIRSVLDAVDYLMANGSPPVSSLYKRSLPLGRTIWSGYTVEDLRHNVSTILLNAPGEYGAFLNGNRLRNLDSEYLNERVALVHFADFSKWSQSDSLQTAPFIETFTVDNPDGKIPKVTLIEGTSEAFGVKPADEHLILNGSQRKIQSIIVEGADYLFQRFPMQNVIYRMLRDDLANTYGLRISH